MNIIVYTVNIGGYDEFREPKITDPNIDYYYITDNNNTSSNVYKIINYQFADNTLDNKRKSRFIKCNPHLVLPEHDISIWYDSSFLPKFIDANVLLENIGFNDKNIMIYKHRLRNCLYDESRVVKNMKLDLHEIIDNQMRKYFAEGFPQNYGLFETGFIVRRNNIDINRFNETWWHEIINYSYRDQLSQMYASWKTNVKIDPIVAGQGIYNNPFIGDRKPHRSR